MASDSSFPVAIVGLSAELPGGSGIERNIDFESFHHFLLRGEHAYQKVPRERFNASWIKGTSNGQVVTDTGTFLKDLDLFDSVEFGITNKDARLMNVGTRKLIESAFLALVDSGIRYRGRNVGCYMSAVAHDMFSLSGHDDTEASRGAFSYGPSAVANRVSYHLDLRGPTIPLDTACSSTLHATHLAVQALRSGECEAAVVGGSQINHRLTEWIIYSHGGILSPDGKCKPFDASADGFGRGEAVVSIVLKPLEVALRDRDQIYATILGTGVNSSGSLAPVNAPVASAQQDAMFRAFAQAKRSPREVDFVELHATGTASGDPTEANWVGEQFSRDSELLVGSVKGNMGHTEISAFLVSLCKVCHIIRHGIIPPTINLTKENPAIRWKEYRMRAPITAEQLQVLSLSGRALIAMSSSGIGGANGHCVIEAHKSNKDGYSMLWASTTEHVVPLLLIAGGLSSRSATATCGLLQTTLPPEFASLGRTLGRRARSMLWNSYSVVTPGSIPKFTEPHPMPRTPPKIVYVFSGQGPQYLDMGRELFGTCIPFRNAVLELDNVYSAITGKSLIDDAGLFGHINEPPVEILGDIWPISITLPALTILQIALVDTLKALGVAPDVVVGHSAGEIAAMYASGASSKKMAIELAVARSQAMSSLEHAGGAMAAIGCSASQARKIITAVIANLGPGPLEIACYNSPNAVTLSGAKTHVVASIQRAKEQGILATLLRTRVPVHSSIMSICQQEYEQRLRDVFQRHALEPTKVEVFSTLTGAKLTAQYTTRYFWDNTIGPVLFDSAIASIHSQYTQAVFVELGPHPVLSSYIAEIVGQQSSVLGTLRRSESSRKGELTAFIHFVGGLFCSGYSNVDLDVLYGTAESASLPHYPFSKKKIPYIVPTFETARQMQDRRGPLNYAQLRINVHTHPELADHVIKQEPIMPAAGFLEMALEFGARTLWNVEFHSILSLSSEIPTPVDVKLEGPLWSIRSRLAMEYAETWPLTYNRVHATGSLSIDSMQPMNVSRVPINSIRSRLQKWDMKDFYTYLDSFANYGPTFRRVVSCYHGIDTSSGQEEFLLEIRGAADDLTNLHHYRIHPAILDSALHFVVHPLVTGATAKGHYYLPSKLGMLSIHDVLVQCGVPEKMYAYGTVVAWKPDSLTYDVVLVDEQGRPLCTLKALEIASHGEEFSAIQKRHDIATSPLDICLPRGPVRELIPGADDGEKYIHEWNHDVHKCALALRQLHIVPYKRGHEMAIQEHIHSWNASEATALCFIASEGLDGDAILGFTRSLRKEYKTWDVYCIVFSESWPIDAHERSARYLCAHPLAEREMLVDEDGTVRVTRVISSSPPLRTVPFDPEKLWVCKDGALSQVSSLIVPNQHVLVRVTGFSSSTSTCRAFIGTVAGSSNIYAGITFGPPSNYVIAHRGSLLELSDSHSGVHGSRALASIISVLGIGHARFEDPSRLEGSCILVTHCDTTLGKLVCQTYEERGVRISKLLSRASILECLSALSLRPKVVVTANDMGMEDYTIHAVRQQRQADVFQWDDQRLGVAGILDKDPWAIGDALKLAYLGGPNEEALIPPLHTLPLEVAKSDPVTSAELLFDSRKAYILVGGIGGLGIPVACWMYQNGAREIILTSRSGTAQLAARSEFMALRILRYLHSLQDLTLRTVSVDASSVGETRELVLSIRKPIGGCMIMTAGIADRAFALHTTETYERPFTAKVDALRSLEQALDISSLDFLLVYSSVSGLLGNAGQTNYSSANTALAGLIRPYRNAAAIYPPMINNTGLALTVAATDSTRWSLYRSMSSWASTWKDMCESVGDALLKLHQGSTHQYVPDLDWGLVQVSQGASPIYNHLVEGVPVLEESGVSTGSMINLRDIVCSALDIDQEDLAPDTPLTSYGLDSLSAAALSSALSPIIVISQLQLLADITLNDLEHLRDNMRALVATSSPDACEIHLEQDSVPKPDVEEEMKERVQGMMMLLHKYSEDLPVRQLPDVFTAGKTLLLTGATGSIGAYFISRVLSSTKFVKVFAIVRPPFTGGSAKDRLVSVFNSRGLDTSILLSRNLVVLEGDVSKEKFGINEADYNEILGSVTHVVHLAWPIDFLAPLHAFDPHVGAVRHIVDFAASSLARVKLLFASTAGLFKRPRNVHFIPETLVEDPLIAVSSGYAESKWVAERLIAMSEERGLLSFTIVRFGQLSGSSNGHWNTSEWIPSMISASVALGHLPDASGEISWLPVDVAADVLLDFVESSSKVLHVRHPHPLTWSEIFSFFSLVLGLPVIAYADWVARLEQCQFTKDNTGQMRYLERGLRLLDVFRAVLHSAEPLPDVMAELAPNIDIRDGLQESSTLRSNGLSQLGIEDVRCWVAYWRRAGVLPPHVPPGSLGSRDGGMNIPLA